MKPLQDLYPDDFAHCYGCGRLNADGLHVKSEWLEPQALLDALKQGHYYASQGPQIFDIAVNGDELTVISSAAQTIYLTGGGSVSQRQRGDRIFGATFALERFRGSYCRVTVVDDWGRRAWSNPIWLDTTE